MSPELKWVENRKSQILAIHVLFSCNSRARTAKMRPEKVALNDPARRSLKFGIRLCSFDGPFSLGIVDLISHSIHPSVNILLKKSLHSHINMV